MFEKCKMIFGKLLVRFLMCREEEKIRTTVPT